MPDNNHGKHVKCLDWSDERNTGDPIMVTLVKGFAFYDNGGDACHTRGFDNQNMALKAIRQAATCDCLRCKS